MKKILNQRIIFGCYPILKVSLCSFFILSSCSFLSFAKGKSSLDLVDFNDLNLNKVHFRDSLNAFIESCKTISKYEENFHINKKLVSVRIVDYRKSCENALAIKGTITRKKFIEFLRQNFKVYKVRNVKESFFTGYFLPEIEASFEYSDIYQYPIYKKPATLSNISHLLSRKKIYDGALQHLNLEIAWAKSDIDLFFLHIQGSGVLKMPNGERYMLSYSESNGHKYYAIGKYFKEKSLLDNINAYSIKKWLLNNPEQKNDVLNMNPSFIFFKFGKNMDVVGGSSSKLIANSSLAVDDDLYPYGLPVLIETEVPNYYKKGQKKEYSNVLIMQDTGSDIIGANRGDIYFGYGEEAEYQASMMKNHGKMYIFVPNNAVVH